MTYRGNNMFIKCVTNSESSFIEFGSQISKNDQDIGKLAFKRSSVNFHVLEY